MRISSGVPYAMRTPKSSTATSLERPSTIATSCSTSSNEICSSLDDGAERAAELRGLVTVESRRRLVEEHDRRTGRERPCDLDASCGAEREHRRRGVGHAAEVEQVDEVVDAFLLVGGARVQRAGGDEIAPQPPALVAHAVPEHDVLAHGEAHEQLELLERAGEPEPRPLRGRRARDPAGRRGTRRPPAGAAGRTARRRAWSCPRRWARRARRCWRAARDRLTSLRATRPPKRTVTLRASIDGLAPAHPRPRRGRWSRRCS